MISKMAKRRGEKGFTLIELMIVVAIIGILAAIAIPNFISFKKKAVLGTAVANLETARGSLAQFSADQDTACYPPAADVNTYAKLVAVLGTYGLKFATNPASVRWSNANYAYAGGEGAADCTLYTLTIEAADGETIFKGTTMGTCCSNTSAPATNCTNYAKSVLTCADMGIE